MNTKDGWCAKKIYGMLNTEQADLSRNNGGDGSWGWEDFSTELPYDTPTGPGRLNLLQRHDPSPCVRLHISTSPHFTGNTQKHTTFEYGWLIENRDKIQKGSFIYISTSVKIIIILRNVIYKFHDRGYFCILS